MKLTGRWSKHRPCPGEASVTLNGRDLSFQHSIERTTHDQAHPQGCFPRRRLGTRFLPVTKAVQKEMLTVVCLAILICR